MKKIIVPIARPKAERAPVETEWTSCELVRAIQEAQEELERVAADIRERLDHVREELEAKIEALEEQAADASAEVRSRIERRIAALHAELGERARLESAYELVREESARPQTAVTRAQR